MLSGPRALLLPRYLRHRSYVILSNVFDMDHRVFLVQNCLGCTMDIVLLHYTFSVVGWLMEAHWYG
jgi:hypothetical protein